MVIQELEHIYDLLERAREFIESVWLNYGFENELGEQYMVSFMVEDIYLDDFNDKCQDIVGDLEKGKKFIINLKKTIKE